MKKLTNMILYNRNGELKVIREPVFRILKSSGPEKAKKINKKVIKNIYL